MGGQFHGNIIFLELYHRLPRRLACCKVDMGGDAALLNNPVGVVSPFPCRGPMLLRLCGVSAGGGQN